jgi:hypothetical protein
MKDWKLSAQPQIPSGDFVFSEVLVDYDGPQVALFKSGSAIYFGIAADGDDDFSRWICALVSAAEIEALLEGSTPMRQVLLKDTVLIVDIAHNGVALRTWEAPPSDLSADALPLPGDLLPSAQAKAGQREAMILAGQGVVENRIEFRKLGDFVHSMQRLWNAFAQLLEGKPTAQAPIKRNLSSRASLSFVAASPGSVGLTIHPIDQALFFAIAEEYKKVIRIGDNLAQLRETLSHLGPRVQSAFRNYLETLSRHELEVTIRWQNNASFVGANAARRIFEMIDTVESSVAADIEVYGHLTAFNVRNGTFEFFSLEDDETFAGSVSPHLLEENETMEVGWKADYYGIIEAISLSALGVKTQYTLKVLERLEGSE